MIRRVAVIAACAGLAVVTTWWVRDRHPLAVASVGSYQIAEGMIAARRRHIDQYYPGSGTRRNAFAQLLEGFVAAEVLRQNGAPIDEKALEREHQRIERESRNPELLARVQETYAGDDELYRVVGILPDFARSRADTFARSAVGRDESARQAASRFIDSVIATPARFREAAATLGLRAQPLVLGTSEEAGSSPDVLDLSPRSPEELEVRQKLEQESALARQVATSRLAALVASVPVGGVHPRTVETPEAFLVVRVTGREREMLALEIVAFPKPDPSAWFLAEARRVPIRINDPALEEELRISSPWAKALLQEQH